MRKLLKINISFIYLFTFFLKRDECDKTQLENFSNTFEKNQIKWIAVGEISRIL